MNHSGDAAEQIVRMSLEGVEVAARITGTAAKEIALLLLAALKSPEKSGAAGGMKLKGKERLTSMLKSGKALEIFSVKERDLRTFVREAKQYGIVYCVLRNSKNTPDGLCDVMVKADDAPKINRIVERFKFATVDKAQIESEIVQDRAERTPEAQAEPETVGDTTPPDVAPAEPDAPEINDVDALLDQFMGTDEGKAEPERTEAERDTPPTLDTPDAPAPTVGATPEAEEINDVSALIDGMLGEEPPEPEKPAPKKSRRSKREPAPSADERQDNPLAEGGEKPPDTPTADSPTTESPTAKSPTTGSLPMKTNPSERSYESVRQSASTPSTRSKPSVKQELREITATRAGLAAQKAREADAPKRDEPTTEKPKNAPAPTHKQPQNRRGKQKSKKNKGKGAR